jgi:ferredoxin
MSGSAVVLLCGRLAGVELDGPNAVLVDDLCRRPEAAAGALRSAGGTRAVLGLCDGCGSTVELLAACRRAGAAPFGVETVRLVPGEGAARVLAAARAKVEMLPPGERGRPTLGNGGYSRRALLSLAPAMVVSPVAVVDEVACVGTTRCALCAPVCPHGAIRAEEGLPVVDTSGCDGCGRCVPACPTGAVHLTGFSHEQLEAQLNVLLEAPAQGIVFVCERAASAVPGGWAAVVLPSLSLVTAGWVLQALAHGAPAVRLLPCTEECCAGWERTAALCRRVLAALGDPHVDVRVAAIAPKGAPEPVPPLSPLGADGGAPRLTEPHATADAVVRLARDDVPPVEDAASPLGTVAFDAEACTVCGACATACPTRAILLEDGPEEVTLRHDPALCTHCGRCVEVCPEDSLGVTAEINTELLRGGPFVLIGSAQETCGCCGAPLPPLAMRRRIRELLGDELSGSLDLCAVCLALGRSLQADHG